MIRYYAGVEGSGKTCMMTRDLYRHYLAGGRVLAFPGYELYGKTKKQVLSEPFMPEQILTLLDGTNVNEIRHQKIAIAMDEVLNFFNHHNWYNKICDIMYVILAQRRKLGVVVTMTGPEFEKLPADIRGMVHEVVRCWDAHSFNRESPRGQVCKYYKEDKRGLLSNPRFRFSCKRKFYMKEWFKHYDTYAAVGALSQFLKIKIKGKEVVYDQFGKPIITSQELDTNSMDGLIEQYRPKEDPRVGQVEQVLSYLKNKGIVYADNDLLCGILKVPHLMGRNGIGSVLKELGAEYDRSKKVYDLSGVT